MSVEISIVIPVYRSGPWLGELVSRIQAAMRELESSFEVILVNDASPDSETWQAIEALAHKYSWVRGYDMLYNVGQFRAIICGLERAEGRLILTLDDDLQHPPEEIPKLLKAIRENPEAMCVMGVYERKQHSWLRNLGSSLFHTILKCCYGKRNTLRTSSFRVMRSELARAVVHYRSARPLLGAITVQLTRQIVEVPVKHHPRTRGGSGYRLLPLVGRTVDAIVYRSTAPLRFFSILGFFTATIAFIAGLATLYKWMTGKIGVPGYTSIVLTIAFFSGTILMGVGILGEYIARLITELSGPAPYEIRQTTARRPRQNPAVETAHRS